MLIGEKKKSSLRLRIFLLVLFLFIGAVAAGWFWNARYSGPARINFIVLKINRETVKILPGEKISLHPSDRVRVAEISTNIPLSLGVRLFSEGIDLGALQDSELAVSELLGSRDLFDRYSFKVEAKHKNSVLGHFALEISPYLEDWLEKADRIINADQRILFLEKAASVLPTEKAVQERLLQEYKAKGYLQKAAALVEQSASSGATRDKLREVADLHLRSGNTKGVISALEKLLELAPEDARARFELAEALEKADRWEAAIVQYEALLLKTGEDASVPIQKRLGYAYIKTGRLEKAIGAFLAAAKWDQKDANLYYNLAYLYEKKGDADKAAFYLRNAVVLNPDDTAGRLRLAERFIESSEWKRAEEIVSEVLERNPQSREALLMLAKVFEGMKDLGRLAGIYKRLYQADPQNDTILFNLAVVEYERGNLQEALQLLHNYKDLHGEDEAIHRVLFDIHRRLENKEEAAREAEKLIALNPSYLPAYSFLFSHLVDKGLYDEIIGVMRKGVAANPNAEELLEYLLDAYTKTGRELEAMDTMEAILKIKVKSPSFLMRLAVLREKHGQNDKAMELYKRVLDADPDNTEAESAYLRLRLRVLGVDEN